MVEVAVIPAAGFGTRVLPASKAVSKELFPLYDRPAIHITLSECVRAGIKEVVLVLSKRKLDIFRYFQKDPELERFLRKKKKLHLLKPLEEFKGINITYVIQKEQKGLGHAVLCAERKVRGRPFAVLLPDDFFITKDGLTAISELIKVFVRENPKGGVFLAKKVLKKDISKYGVPRITRKKGNIMWVKGTVEKPPPDKAPSEYAVVGRYVFSPEIFRWIKMEREDERGEIQLAGAMGNFSEKVENSFIAVSLSGTWLDIGSPEGYVKASNFFLRKKEILSVEKSHIKGKSHKSRRLS